ncbi:MAG: hypothetical protein M3220_18175 [Chloroflexota bacterium]|nr:hypothetical protein [Chloroflexota bacterium]
MRGSLNFSAILVATALAAGCAQDAPTAVDASESMLFAKRGNSENTSAWMNEQLAAVRRATARFHRVEVALQEGYVSTVQCVALPGVGAMGVHYSNPSLLRDATYDPLRPEVLVYEPQENGNFKLVAVEYVIFRAPWVNAGNTADPMFGDVPFVRAFGPAAHGIPDHYELHVWLWQHNPAGMFAQWNPQVSCPSQTAH